MATSIIQVKNLIETLERFNEESWVEIAVEDSNGNTFQSEVEDVFELDGTVYLLGRE